MRIFVRLLVSSFIPRSRSELTPERLSLGKFDTNDAIVPLATFAYNCLCLIRQMGLTGEISPIQHLAKRRGLRTELLEVMHRASKFVSRGQTDSGI